MAGAQHTTQYQRFAKLLRKTREESGVIQGEVARRMKLSESKLSKSLSGSRRMDIIEVWRFCRAINMPLTEFAARLEQTLR